MSSSSSPAVDFRTVDISKIVIGNLEKKDKGNLSCTPQYKNEITGQTGLLCIQTPVCRLPFGLSSQARDDGTLSYSVSGSFDQYRTNPLMADFYKFCSNLQDYIIHTAAHNSVAWFGEETEVALCARLMNKWIKVSKDKEMAAKYDPTFKGTVRSKKDKEGNETGFWANCFGTDGLPMDINKIEPGCTGSMKIKLTSVYVINGKFGFTWDVEWVRVKEGAAGRKDDYVENLYGEAPTPALPAITPQESNVDLYAHSSAASTTITSNGGDKRERAEEDTTTAATTSPAAAAPAPTKRAKKGGN